MSSRVYGKAAIRRGECGSSVAITTDYLIIGGGIIGICVAAELKRRYSGSRVDLIEKESTCGQHASGRNSGVLHAGFYYTADSLKAKFTRQGNAELTAFCLDRGLSLNACGKLVVAQGESELKLLDELLRRGRANGVPLEEVDEITARDMSLWGHDSPQCWISGADGEQRDDDRRPLRGRLCR